MRPPTNEQLRHLVVQALGSGGSLVHLNDKSGWWWEARCESNREKSAIVVLGCTRAAVAHGMADVLKGIAKRREGRVR